MNESCHIWMSHVTYEWVMSHMNESCLIWVSHVTYEWVMSHMNESCLIWMSHVSYEWVMSHMNESCLIWMCQVTVNESCPTYMSTIFMHVPVVCAPVKSHMSQVSCEWIISQWTSHVPRICQQIRGTWLVRVCQQYSCMCLCFVHLLCHTWGLSHMNESCHNEWAMCYVYVNNIYACVCGFCACYGVATISRLLKIIGLFCKRAL